MSRPAQVTIQNGEQAWDTDVNDNFTIVLSQPLPIWLSASLTEANVASTWAPSSYDKCVVWVNHTVRGYTLYRSNGSAWKIVRGATALYRRTISAITTLQDYDDEVICGGTTYTVTLPAVEDGRMLFIKRNSSGTITLSPASGLIDGAASFLLEITSQAVILMSDGTNWFTVGSVSSPQIPSYTTVSGVGTLSMTAVFNFVVCGGTSYTLTLPTAVGNTGKVFHIKRNSSGDITIDGAGTETIDGALTFVLGTALEAVSIVSDGSNWWAY